MQKEEGNFKLFPTYSEEVYRDEDGLIHRDGGPAYIEYDQKGQKIHESWLQHGQYHRTDGPAKIIYQERNPYDEGYLMTEYWYQNGQLHRTDGPAEIEYGWSAKEEKHVNYERWYLNGNSH